MDGPVDGTDPDDVVDEDADGELDVVEDEFEDEDEDEDDVEVEDEDEDQDAFEDEEGDLGEDAMGDHVADEVVDVGEREFNDGPAGEGDTVGGTEGSGEARDTGVQEDRRLPSTPGRRPVVAPAPRTAPRRVAADGRTPAPRTEPRRPSGAPDRATRATVGRWRVSRIASRGHIDLLVLLALRQGPGDGRDVIARLLADSGGALQLPEQTVYRTLHRLARNRLVLRRRDPVVRRARYVLTETGERVWRSRLGQWQAFVRTVDAVARVGVEK